MKVGYVGLGAMGRALATHLIAAADLHVFDRSASAIATLQELGATPAASLTDLAAGCAVVFLCLPRSADVEQVLFGSGGLAEALSPGTIVIDQTSGIPIQTRRFSDALAARNISLIDAPVAGGVPAAIVGGITIMASGPRDAYQTAHPLLEAITRKVHCCSERVGDAQALKSVNNIINAAYRISILEIAAVGRFLGLSIDQMAEALDAGPGRNFMTAKLLPAIAEGRSSTDFSLALMVKDLDQASALSMEVGASTPASEIARGLIRVALNQLGADARLDDIVPFMEQLTGQAFMGTAPPMADQDARSALAHIEAVLTVSNRMIVQENILAAARMGLDLVAIEPIIASGSAYSAAATTAFAIARGEAPNRGIDPAECAHLSELAVIAARGGIPLLMLNTIRSRHLSEYDQPVSE